MKHSDENFLNMVHSALDTMKKDPSVWSSEFIIGKEISAIERDYNQILGNLNVNSRLDTVFRHDTENEDINSIIRATIKLSRRMYLYARHHNDEVMLKLLVYFESTMATGSEKIVLSCCHKILSRAEWMHYYLKAYNVSVAQLNILHDAIDNFEQHQGARSKFKSNNVSRISHVSHQIAELKERLAILDELVDGLIANSEFISKYHDSRIIINYNQVSKSENESLFR